MRIPAVLALIVMASPGLAFDQMRWPDPDIPVPASIRSFVSAECAAARGTSEETVDECIQAERYGYRAVVMMLSEADTTQRAVERYRVCSGGLGSLGGMFHRRKAVCIGKPLRVAWQFEFMQKATLDHRTKVVRADTPGPAEPLAWPVEMEFVEQDADTSRRTRFWNPAPWSATTRDLN